MVGMALQGRKGSSPLTRGARPPASARTGHHGLIPAHAGSTSDNDREIRPFGAHPRSRGEHDSSGRPYDRPLGSSPLTRGAPGITRMSQDWGGLIPAHAGSTSGVGGRRRNFPAHPRSRGEHTFPSWHGTIRGGSSPLTRGALPGEVLEQLAYGLIPAHAGSTSHRRGFRNR